MSSIPRTPLAVHAAWLATLIAALCLGGAAERGPAAAEPDASRPGPAAETAADEELVAPVATRSTRRVQRPAVQRVSDRSRRPSSAGNVMRATLREEEEDASVEADMPAAPPPPAPSPARSPRRIQELADDEEKELAGIPDPAELEMAADTPPPAPVDDESLPAASEEFVPEPPLPLPLPRLPARQRVAPPAADSGPPDPTTPVPPSQPATPRTPATNAGPATPTQPLRQPLPAGQPARVAPLATMPPKAPTPPPSPDAEGEAVPVPPEAPLPPSSNVRPPKRPIAPPPAPADASPVPFENVPTPMPAPMPAPMPGPVMPPNSTPGASPAPPYNGLVPPGPAATAPLPTAPLPTAPNSAPFAPPAGPAAPLAIPAPAQPQPAPPAYGSPLPPSYSPAAGPVAPTPLAPAPPVNPPPYTGPIAPAPYAGPMAPPAYSAPVTPAPFANTPPPAYSNPNPPLSAAPSYPRESVAAPAAPEYVPAPPASTSAPTYTPAPPAMLSPPTMVNRYPEEVEEEAEGMVEEDVEEEVEEEGDVYEDLPPPGPRYQAPRSNLRTDFYNFARRACPPGLFVGSQLTMLSPLGESAPVVKLEDLVAERTYASDADAGIGVGSRTWIGFRNPAGSGFRVSYWNFDAQFNTPSPVVPTIAQPTTLDTYYLAAQTFDIELMNGFCFANGFLDISFGARYAKMDRNLTTLGYGEVGPADAKVSLYGVGSIANSIDGLGFTASIGGRNMLWPAECPPGPGPACGPLGISLFWNVRGSILWSETEAFARTEAHAFTKKFGGSTAFNSDSAYVCTKDDMVGIGEMQIGFEYQRCLKHFPGFLTVRFAVEGQYWGAGSVSARSDSTAFLIGGPPLFGGAASATAFSEAGDLSLLGASMSATISF